MKEISSVCHPMRLWAVVLLVLLSMLWGGNVKGGVGNAWDHITSLELLDGEAFREIAYPLVQMSANAYRYPAVIPIDGWALVDAIAPVHGGMHAVLYQEESDMGRMALAFRGTQVDGSESSRADVCADEILWGDTPSFLEPVDCSEFSSEILDYYKQAVDYTRKVLDVYSDTSILLTGHSLGAGLAVLMAATFGTRPLLPVVAFSCAGTKNVIEKRSLKLTADHDKKLYIIADKWDQIMRSDWSNQVGTLCLYETAITVDCIACFNTVKASESSTDPCLLDVVDLQQPSPGNIEVIALQQGDTSKTQSPDDGMALMSTPADCFNCFLETHYLQHVIDLVELGNNPVCEFRPLPVGQLNDVTDRI